MDIFNNLKVKSKIWAQEVGAQLTQFPKKLLLPSTETQPDSMSFSKRQPPLTLSMLLSLKLLPEPIIMFMSLMTTEINTQSSSSSALEVLNHKLLGQDMDTPQQELITTNDRCISSIIHKFWKYETWHFKSATKSI